MELVHIGLAVAGALAGLIALIALWVALELTKPTPKGGSPRTLPNGMTVQQWQKGETDFLYKEIFGDENAYARGGIQFRPGATVVDAGANIGMFTLYAALRCKGAATIYSFEPIPSTYSVLAANAQAANGGQYDSVFERATGAALRIKPINCGLSDAPASVTFEHHPNFTVWSTQDASFAGARLKRIADDLPRSFESYNWFVRQPLKLVTRLISPWVLKRLGRTEKVPAKLVTLSSVIDSESIGTIDLLKVDVEGAELAVLRGIAPGHWARIQQVALEVESFEAVRQVRSLLESKGFTTSAVESERERNPGVQSEVSMVYATRPSYLKEVAQGEPTAAAAAAVQEEEQEQEEASVQSSATKRSSRRKHAA